jgi:hypothetical protein
MYMTQRLLPLIFLLTCFLPWQILQAQPASLPLNKSAQYEIIPIANGGFLVAEITNFDQYQRGQVNLILYDSLSRDVSNSIITLPWQPVFNGSVSAGNLTILSFYSAVTYKTVFLGIDHNGKQVSSKELEVKKAVQIPKLSSFSSTDGFFITSRIERNWSDITISKMDFQFNLLWKKEFRQEKDAVLIDKLEKIGDNIFIFQKINPGSKKYEATLAVLNEKTGNTLFEKNLTDGQVIRTPTAFRMDGDNLLVAGLYVMGKTIKDNYCDGFFLSSYAPNGQVQFETFNAWQHEVKKVYIQDKIDHSRLTANGTEKAILEYIKKTDNGYAVLAETFKSVANGADAASLIASGLVYSMVGVSPFINPKLTTYKVQDMLLYEFTNTGQLRHVTKIDKPETFRTLNVDMGELKAINTVQEYGVFDYKFYASSSLANDEHIFFREYVKKESYKVNMFKLAGLQPDQVKSYSLLMHVPDFLAIKSFDFVQRNSSSVLLYYHTKNSIFFKVLYPKDFN